jgi:hypothetical protein
MKEIFIGNTLRTPTMLACITRSVGDISRNARVIAHSRQDGVAWLSHTLLSAPDGGQPLSLHAYGGGQRLDVVGLVMPLTVDEEGRRA